MRDWLRLPSLWMTETLDSRPPEGRSGPRVLKLVTFRSAVAGSVLALLPVALWSLTHQYHGLVGDSELYAVQALARNDPSLAHDVFLSGASQDRFTVFSPIYSVFIWILGLRTAAISLLVLFKVCFYGAIWAFSRRLYDSRTATLTTALAIVIPGEYGAYHVFHIAEDMLTARTLAEALAMTALSFHVYGRKTAALGVATFALCLHALMALPMVLLLLGLSAGVRATIVGALVIVTSVLIAALAAALAPHWTPSFLAVMDPGWLEMVRERSQFVFLQLWRLRDWELNIQPLLSLLLTMVVLCDARIRALCGSALTVGVAGLALALVAGVIGPVAILLQGQAWRWLWVPHLVGLLLVVPTVFYLWRSGECGPLCAVLLLVGWLFAATGGVYWVAASLSLWAGRRHVPESAGPYLRFSALAMGALVIAWIFAHGWPTLTSSLAASGIEDKSLYIARRIMGLDGVPVIFAFLVYYAIVRSRSIAVAPAIALALGTVTAFAAPGALEDGRAEGSAAQIAEFADWRGAIPPGANVFVASRYYSAGFSWFTLQRPSYLTVDQSSGVVFSSATAAEIRRRSEVLRPIEEPDWRLLTRRATHGARYDARALPLTKDRLVLICADPVLDFVVAQEDVGLGPPMRHDRSGPWNGWNLYDCKRVNSLKDSG
jgi:hypothetical protein